MYAFQERRPRKRTLRVAFCWLMILLPTTLCWTVDDHGPPTIAPGSPRPGLIFFTVHALYGSKHALSKSMSTVHTIAFVCMCTMSASLPRSLCMNGPFTIPLRKSYRGSLHIASSWLRLMWVGVPRKSSANFWFSDKVFWQKECHVVWPSWTCVSVRTLS